MNRMNQSEQKIPGEQPSAAPVGAETASETASGRDAIAAATPPDGNLAALPPKKTKESFLPGGTPKEKIFLTVKTLLLLCFSSFLVALSSYSLIAPNNFAIGGITGVAIILEKATGGKIPQSVSIFCINFPLLFISFFAVKKKFALMSLANVTLQSVFLSLMENLGMPRLVFDEKIFAALAGGIGIGTAIALAFKIGGSTGGMDVIAVIVQKKFPAPSIAWMLFILNCIVIASSFFVYRVPGDAMQSLLPLIMAACEQYVESKANDTITNGFHSAIEFRIITDKPEKMALEIISRLGRGVTSVPATGMYTHETHSMLICVIHRRQINTFRKLLKEVDPDSFAVMSGVSQVLGLGFFSGEN